MDQGHADIVRCEFPDPEPLQGTGRLQTAISHVLEPLRRDRRVVVYPIALVMAVGIGLLGHLLRPADVTAVAPGVPVPSNAPISVTDRDVPPAESLSEHPSDGHPADPSPRTR